jgi:hypothetical protein
LRRQQNDAGQERFRHGNNLNRSAEASRSAPVAPTAVGAGPRSAALLAIGC